MSSRDISKVPVTQNVFPASVQPFSTTVENVTVTRARSRSRRCLWVAKYSEIVPAVPGQISFTASRVSSEKSK